MFARKCIENHSFDVALFSTVSFYNGGRGDVWYEINKLLRLECIPVYEN